MGFQNIPKPEKPEFYLDTAVAEAQRASRRRRTELEGSGVARIIKSRMLERTKVQAMSKVLMSHLTLLVKRFPSLNALDPFYQDLAECTINVDMYRKALAAMQWAAERIRTFAKAADASIRGSTDPSEMNKARRAFLGRAASIVNQIGPQLQQLREAARIMRRYPSIKTKYDAIIITGFPNVGKSTLLRKLTGSAPKTAPYPFTTKQLMIGNITIGSHTLQVIDTPGLLDRPLSKRNSIERQAALALKHLARFMLFVIDPTDSCGYPVKAQLKLLEDLHKHFGLPCAVLINKADKATPVQRKAAESAVPKGTKYIWVSAETGEGIADVLSTLEKAMGP